MYTAPQRVYGRCQLRSRKGGDRGQYRRARRLRSVQGVGWGKGKWIGGRFNADLNSRRGVGHVLCSMYMSTASVFALNKLLHKLKDFSKSIF